MGLSDLFGIGFLIAFIILLIVRTGTERRWPTTLRALPAFDALRRAIERAVESGKRVHVSLGTGTLIGTDSGPALAGLTALSMGAGLTRDSDRAIVASSGNGAVAAASQDTLRAAADRQGRPGQYDWTQGRMLGPTPFTYVATLPTLLESDRVSVQVMLGHFESEGALAADMAVRQGSFVLAGTDGVPSQAMLFATADEPLVGEEAFAAGPYLGAGGMQRASLRVQDLLRAVLLAAILIGTILRTLGIGL